MKKIKALLCDLDGTLVDSEKLHVDSWGAFAREAGIGYDIDFHVFVGTSDKVVAESLRNEHKLEMSEKDIIDGKMKIFYERIEKEISLFTGVYDTLKKYHEAGIAVCVVTSSSRDYLKRALQITDIKGFISAEVSVDDVVNRKPHSEPYDKALAILGISAEEAIAVEDSIAGVSSAKNAGLYTTAVCNSYDALNLSHADRILGSFTQLQDYIENR